MPNQVRPAVNEDIPAIVSWTTDTFEWGDYVPARLSSWIDEADSETLVCVDDSGSPIGVSHVVMLSAREAWLEGARVHPEHRRSGVGWSLNEASVEWARGQGARVARLAVEVDNEAARHQVEKLGYRSVCSWTYGELDPGDGKAVADKLRMGRVSASDVDPAWLFWSASDLAQAGRELISLGWRWRKAGPEDLIGAARGGDFYASVAGWAIVEQPQADWMRVGWLVTSPEDAPGMLDAILDLARRNAVEEVSVFLPNLPWTAECLARAGAELNEILVYAKTL